MQVADVFVFFSLQILQVKAERDREMREQMKRQLEIAEDHLHDAIAAKEKEMTRKNQRLLDEKVETERNAYKLKLAEMISRMNAVEAALSSKSIFHSEPKIKGSFSQRCTKTKLSYIIISSLISIVLNCL